MLPKEFQRKPVPKVSTLPYILLVVLFALIDITLGYLVYNSYLDQDGVYQADYVESTPDTSLTRISSSDLPQTSPSATFLEIEKIQTLADAFMQARLNRNLDQVEPYVTQDFLDKYSQSAFAGSSSPSLEDYEVVDIKYIRGNTYRILVQTNWLLNGDEAGSQDWTLIATKTKEGYRINDYSGE